MDSETQWKFFARNYEVVHGQNLVRAIGDLSVIDSEGMSCYSRIVLELDNSFIDILVNDVSEIIVKINPILPPKNTEKLVDVSELSNLIGNNLSWAWIGTNYLGYLDSLMFSFSGINPTIMLVACASTLNIFDIVPRIK